MLQENLQKIKGIGLKKATTLKSEVGLETVEDFLYYLPRKYIDRSSFKKIKDCFMNETVTVAGTITQKRIIGKNKKRLEVKIDDGTDTIYGIFFGGIQYFNRIFTVDDFVIFAGKINFFKVKQIVHPDFDFIDESSNISAINTGRIVPLYKSTESLKKAGYDSRGFRKTIKIILDNYLHFIEETLSEDLIKKYALMPLKKALLAIHFPESFEEAEKARQRLAFNEVFFLQYYLALSKKYLKQQYKKKRLEQNKNLVTDFTSSLPFALTEDQQQAIKDIIEDLTFPYPMNRLLHGDVGSGKTVVAIAASVMSVSQGNQAAIMAPTEILASQHFDIFKKLLPSSLSITLLTGSTPQQKKKAIYSDLQSGEIDIIIGTHALLQSEVQFHRPGLIVIDEQHRFGVEQRAHLRKKGDDTDLLIMTATPIPRSLSMTLYGDLDVSAIRHKPDKRKEITTLAFPMSRLKGVYNSIEKYISQGRQIYYVLPLIEESEKLNLKSVMTAYENLSKIFPHRNVTIIHGKQKASEKDDIMKNFYEGAIDILVSTTVIEVGIDVANANVIIIEHAERFGLSQLHQLRGRVGRGEHQSYCILIHPDSISPESKKRIDIMVSTNDGFTIAEEDLKARGAGEFLGARQHGHGGAFEFLDLTFDMEIIFKARDEALKKVEAIPDVSTVLANIQNNTTDRLLDGIRKKHILSLLS